VASLGICSAFRYDVRPRVDVVDPLEDLESDLLRFVMLSAYKEFGPLMNGWIPYARLDLVKVG